MPSVSLGFLNNGFPISWYDTETLRGLIIQCLKKWVKLLFCSSWPSSVENYENTKLDLRSVPAPPQKFCEHDPHAHNTTKQHLRRLVRCFQQELWVFLFCLLFPYSLDHTDTNWCTVFGPVCRPALASNFQTWINYWAKVTPFPFLIPAKWASVLLPCAPPRVGRFLGSLMTLHLEVYKNLTMCRYQPPHVFNFICWISKRGCGRNSIDQLYEIRYGVLMLLLMDFTVVENKCNRFELKNLTWTVYGKKNFPLQVKKINFVKKRFRMQIVSCSKTRSSNIHARCGWVSPQDCGSDGFFHGSIWRNIKAVDWLLHQAAQPTECASCVLQNGFYFCIVVATLLLRRYQTLEREVL